MATTTAEQLACARRELAMRQRVYPKWVAAERMDQASADHETTCRVDIVARLEAAQRREEAKTQPQLFPE